MPPLPGSEKISKRQLKNVFSDYSCLVPISLMANGVGRRSPAFTTTLLEEEHMLDYFAMQNFFLVASIQSKLVPYNQI